MCMFYRSLFVLLYFFLWPLCCLSFMIYGFWPLWYLQTFLALVLKNRLIRAFWRLFFFFIFISGFFIWRSDWAFFVVRVQNWYPRSLEASQNLYQMWLWSIRSTCVTINNTIILTKYAPHIILYFWRVHLFRSSMCYLFLMLCFTGVFGLRYLFCCFLCCYH